MAPSARCAASLTLLALLAIAAPPAPARQAEAIAEALRRPILEPGRPVAEVRAHLAPRVPRMPAIATADEWETIARKLREDVLARVVFRGKAADWRDTRGGVEWQETIEGGPGYKIRKLRYEAIPGLWIPALLYEPETLAGKVPVVLNVNGHDPNGKAADYKQIRCINQAKRGMLALNVEWVGMGQLRGEGFQHGLINAIDLCGTPGVAVHFLAMSRGLDLLLDHAHADPARVAVTGLSGGGWQTIFFSALDTRVTLCDPVAGYSSFRTRIDYFSDLGDSEQTPCDLATVADYAHLTAMRAPRPTLLTYNVADNCCFAAPHALPPLLDAAWPIYAKYGKPANLRVHVNEVPGTHNYLIDNRQALYRMLGDHFYPGLADYSDREIPSESEVKTPEQLMVRLPADNLDLSTIALGLARGLPNPAMTTEIGNPDERARRRSILREVVRAPEADWKIEALKEDVRDGLKAASLIIRVDGDWSVPAVELSRGDKAGSTTILIADQGRAAVADLARERLDAGDRVLALDPFYLGESLPRDHDYLWGLMLASVGERPIGVQAGQVVAAARWARARGDQLVTVVARGPRASTIALVAAALEESSIDGLRLVGPLASLREVIDRRAIYNASPELFCFGLLEQFDIAGLKALVAPRPVEIETPR